MESLLRSVINADKDAQKRMDDAAEQSIKLVASAKAEEEHMIAQAVENAEKELSQLTESARTAAEEKLAAISDARDRKMEEMRQAFSANREKWENEIFTAVRDTFGIE